MPKRSTTKVRKRTSQPSPPSSIQLPILAIDPGTRNTGWYWIEEAGHELYGTWRAPKQRGKRTATDKWNDLDYMFTSLAQFLVHLKPKTVLIEDYHYMTGVMRKRGFDVMCKLVGGMYAMSKMVGLFTVMISPKMKGAKTEPPENWSQHAWDARQLADAYMIKVVDYGGE